MKHPLLRLFPLLTLVILLAAAPASAQLAPGDIALVGMNADGSPDDFAFVALTDLAPGTELHFTDNGWFASGGFRANEGTVTYTAPAFIPAGTVVTLQTAGQMNFAASGDQLLAYQGSDASPSFVYALNNEGAGVWQSDATSSNTSALPAGLVNGTTAVALFEIDNATYAGPTTGTRAELLAAIGDNANWTGDNSSTQTFPASFTVTDGGGSNAPPAFTDELADSSIPAETAFSFTYAATDFDGDVLTFALVDGPTGSSLSPGTDPGTAVFDWTPSAAQAGASYDVVVEVSDGDDATATAAVLTVTTPSSGTGTVFFSEYVEGSSFNKAVEIYNATGSPVALGDYAVEIYFNGSSSPGSTISLSGTLAPGATYVVAHTSADDAIVADLESGSLNFNGDDAVVLTDGSSVVDVIGQVGFDPGSQWGSGLTSTADNTLRRKADDCTGDTDPSDAFDPAVSYDGFAQDTFDGLGAHTATCTGSENAAPFFTATLSDTFVDVGTPVSYDYDASDDDGDALTYSLVDGPAGATIDPASGVLSFTPTAPDAYGVTVGVSDGTTTTTTTSVVGARGTLFPGQSGAALRASLRSAYTPDQTLGYNVGRDVMYGEIDRDADGNVTGVYTGYTVFLPEGVDPSSYLFSNGINAEHTWPQSKGAGDEPQRSDIHNLFPTKDNVNNARGNKPFGEIPDAETQTWYRFDESQSTIPTSDIDSWSESAPGAFEPREVHEGNAARASLYFYAIYEGPADEAFLLEQAATLVDWNGIDPADVDELVRSYEISVYQGNVNPFVLDPSLAARSLSDVLPAGPCPADLVIADFRSSPDAEEYVDLQNVGDETITFSTATCVLGAFTSASYLGLPAVGTLAPGETLRFGASGATDVDVAFADGTLRDGYSGLALLDRESLSDGTPTAQIQPDIVTSLVYLSGDTVYGFYHTEAENAQLYCGLYEGELHPYGQSLCTGVARGTEGTGPIAMDFASMLETAQGESARTDAGASVPTAFALGAAYPNPMRERGTLEVEVPETAEVRVVVYDVLGRTVAVLADEVLEAGRHALALEASRLASGTYVVRMTATASATAGASSFVATERLTVVR